MHGNAAPLAAWTLRAEVLTFLFPAVKAVLRSLSRALRRLKAVYSSFSIFFGWGVVEYIVFLAPINSNWQLAAS
jgi:hypothetical protein